MLLFLISRVIPNDEENVVLHATEEILVLAHIIFNGLQGFIILTIFTMNNRVLKLYKEGFRKMSKKWKKSRNRKVGTYGTAWTLACQNLI